MINIFFNIDNNFIKQCKTVIKSIIANTKSKVLFHIIGVDDIGLDENIKYYKAPDISIIKNESQIPYITEAAVYRIFAPFILPVDRAIYLDCDLIVLKDIKELWNTDIKYIAGVQDGMCKHQAARNNLHHTYINSGVMLMNFENLRKLDYLERIEKTQNGNYDLKSLDQDIFNIAFEKEIELLNPKWNVYSKIRLDTTQEMIEARKNPAIIHWCGYEKPWKCGAWCKEKWEQYT